MKHKAVQNHKVGKETDKGKRWRKTDAKGRQTKGSRRDCERASIYTSLKLSDTNIVQQPLWNWSSQNWQKITTMCDQLKSPAERRTASLMNSQKCQLVLREIDGLKPIPSNFFPSSSPKATTRYWSDKTLLLAICLPCKAPENVFPMWHLLLLTLRLL